jgi:phage shock protein C
MERFIMDFFFWTPLISIFTFLFAIAIPIVIIVVVIVWILSHRDNMAKTGTTTGDARKLYKSNTDKMLAGVCGGLAEYFHIDSTLVRIGLVFFTFCGGSGILLYIIALIAMPQKPSPTAV